jgi:hypothetical protein
MSIVVSELLLTGIGNAKYRYKCKQLQQQTALKFLILQNLAMLSNPVMLRVPDNSL